MRGSVIISLIAASFASSPALAAGVGGFVNVSFPLGVGGGVDVPLGEPLTLTVGGETRFAPGFDAFVGLRWRALGSLGGVSGVLHGAVARTLGSTSECGDSLPPVCSREHAWSMDIGPGLRLGDENLALFIDAAVRFSRWDELSGDAIPTTDKYTISPGVRMGVRF